MFELEPKDETEETFIEAIQRGKEILAEFDEVEASIDDHLPESSDGREEAVNECRERIEAEREETRTLIRRAWKRLQLYRETGSTLTPSEDEAAEKLAESIVEDLRKYCPPLLDDWDHNSHREKHRILAEKLREVKRRLAYRDDSDLETYRDILETEKEYLENVAELVGGLADGRSGALGKEIAEVTKMVATKTQLQHLQTARDVLNANPDISTRDDFEDACPDKGGSVRKRVQELAKKMLNSTKVVGLPSHYHGFDGGFQQLVDDLWTDDLKD